MQTPCPRLSPPRAESSCAAGPSHQKSVQIQGPKDCGHGSLLPLHQPPGPLGMSSQSSPWAALPGQSSGSLPLPACTGRGHQCPHQLREALPVGPVPRLLVVWWPQQVLPKHERRAQRWHDQQMPGPFSQPALSAQRVRLSEGEAGQASPAQGTTHLVLLGPWCV